MAPACLEEHRAGVATSCNLPTQANSIPAWGRPSSSIQEFPRRDSKPKKRLQENRATPCVLLLLMCIIALFSWSLCLGLESLLGNSCIMYTVYSWSPRGKSLRSHPRNSSRSDEIIRGVGARPSTPRAPAA